MPRYVLITSFSINTSPLEQKWLNLGSRGISLLARPSVSTVFVHQRTRRDLDFSNSVVKVTELNTFRSSYDGSVLGDQVSRTLKGDLLLRGHWGKRTRRAQRESFKIQIIRAIKLPLSQKRYNLI